MKSYRQEQIISYLQNTGYAGVEELSKLLYVSLPTVRRDLAELAKKKLISRNHGGAMILSDHNAEIPIYFRNGLQAHAKNLIAKTAAELIKDGDVIFIDASTTTLHILEHLKSKNNITVVTNSAQAAMLLRDENVKMYSTGGQLSGNSLAYFGSFAENTIRNFNIDLMFFSSYGLLKNGEIQDYSDAESHLRNICINQSSTTAFLCDSSKIERRSMFNVNRIQNIDYLITDAQLPKSFPKPKKRIIFPPK